MIRERFDTPSTASMPILEQVRVELSGVNLNALRNSTRFSRPLALRGPYIRVEVLAVR
jgi:hypothetical protein